MKTSQLNVCRISDQPGHKSRYMRAKNTKGVFKLNEAYYYYRPGHFSILGSTFCVCCQFS